MNTVPVAFAKSPAVFFYTLRTKAQPLRKRYMAGHKTSAHMDCRAIATIHILAKTKVPFWRKKWRKKGKKRILIYNALGIQVGARRQLRNEIV